MESRRPGSDPEERVDVGLSTQGPWRLRRCRHLDPVGPRLTFRGVGGNPGTRPKKEQGK